MRFRTLLLSLAAPLLLQSAARAVPLEPPNEGFVAAPIHSSAFHYKLTLATQWPKGRTKPQIVGKSVYIAWDGNPAVRTPQGHPYPMLYVKLEMLLPVSTSLSTQSNKPLISHPYDSGRDLFEFNLAIRRMDSNTADFFVRFYDGAVAEFQLEFGLDLNESVYGIHSSCQQQGVSIVEKNEAKLSGFFFARCAVEDGLLYVAILKPLDRMFVLSDTSHELIETTNQPVIRVVLPDKQEVTRAVIGEMRLTDSKNHTEKYEVVYEPHSRPRRWNGSFGLAPGYATYSEFNKPTINEATMTGKVSLGYKLIPGVLDVAFSAFATVLPYVISPNSAPPAWWLGFNYRAGYTLPVGLGATTFSFLAGWYSWYMFVPGAGYGIKDIQGPQIYLAANHRPVGRLGWMAYFKFAPMSADTNALNFTNFSNREIAVGGAYDLPIFPSLPRRPAITLDVAALNVTIQTIGISQTVVTLGLLYPLF